jgi:agmatinase
LDVTSTFRRGSADAPYAIRIASESIETYSPLLDRDLEDLSFADIGDVFGPREPLESALQSIESAVKKAGELGVRPLILGGEHTITFPVVKALETLYNAVVLVHIDAHSDLREQYEGSTVNHATVMRRIQEVIGPERLIQLGIRSGTREEFSWMRSHGTLMQWGPAAENHLLERIGDRPVYLSVDLDVLDPACFPGTGNPEPGGWFYDDVERLITALDRVKLVGADVVELNPALDPSQASAITAAKIVRELLLVLGATA